MKYAPNNQSLTIFANRYITVLFHHFASMSIAVSFNIPDLLSPS